MGSQRSKNVVCDLTFWSPWKSRHRKNAVISSRTMLKKIRNLPSLQCHC